MGFLGAGTRGEETRNEETKVGGADSAVSSFLVPRVASAEREVSPGDGAPAGNAEGVSRPLRGCARPRGSRAVPPARVPRPRLRDVVTEVDLDRILLLIVDGATYAAAATVAGCRPSALRKLKRSDLAVASRLRKAWLEQGRQLRAKARAFLSDTA